MKLLVFSDSHSNSHKIKEVIDMHKSHCHAVIFLGDGLKDIDYVKDEYTSIPFLTVKGNCDIFATNALAESLIDFDGIKIFFTHGHLYGVKSGYGRLAYRARELEADIVLFGHTHTPIDDVLEIAGRKIRLFNPGSIGYGGSFGVINTSNGVLITSHGKL